MEEVSVDAIFGCEGVTGEASRVVLRLSASATIDCVISTGSTGVGARVGVFATTVLLAEKASSTVLDFAASVGG